MEIEVLEKSLEYRNNYEKIDSKIRHIDLCLGLIEKEKGILNSIEIPVTKDITYKLCVSDKIKGLTEIYASERVFKEEFILFLNRYKSKLKELEHSNRCKFKELM